MNSILNKTAEQALGLAFTSIILYACFGLISCDNNKKQKPVEKQSAENTVYYPINNYIRKQIKLVDSIPYYVYRVLVVNGKRDSTTISRPVFDSLVQQFIVPELEEGSLRKNFSESVYVDESTNSVTLTYTPKDSNATVQNAMVLLDTTAHNVKWTFINMLQNKGDSTILQKIGWKGDESCYINRSVSYADGKRNEMQLNIVWNEKK
jgi:hypothetical protein